MKGRISPRLKYAAAAVVGVALVGGAFTAKELRSSDHQQTALTELHPRLDLADVWVFPGSTDGRTVLGITLASPILPSQNDAAGFFDPNALYMIHVDNNQDGGEDVVFQFSFDQLRSGGQTFDVIGPANPRRVGENFPGPLAVLPGGARHKFSVGAPMMRGQRLNQAVSMQLPNNQGEMQVFAGLRDDPFFIDLPRFFSIRPFTDRRPTSGALSDTANLPAASTFRPKCDANGTPVQDAQNQFFNFDQGCATDFLRGLNALAIVVEVPEGVLTQGRGGSDPVIGVWATISR